MRIVLWSFLSFLAAALLLLPEINTQWNIPDKFLIFIPLTIILLSLFTQLEAISILKQKNALSLSTKENENLKDKVQKNDKLISQIKTKLEMQEKAYEEKIKEIKKLQEIQTDYEKTKKLLTTANEAHKSLALAMKNEEKKYQSLELSIKKKNKDSSQEVLTLLSLLQEKGRFLDFVMDDVESYPDEQVGAAARIIHQGCRKILLEYFDIHPIHKEEEGVSIKIDTTSNKNTYKFIGNFEEKQEMLGTLVHKGWMTKAIDLPKQVDSSSNLNHNIIAPAEVEFK